MDVLLVPSIELHRGVHGSLLDHPPPGVTYLRQAVWHEYLIERQQPAAFSPLQEFALAEVVCLGDTGPKRCVVHSSRLPVYGDVPWIVDADCLLATLLYGRDLIFGMAGNVGRHTIDKALTLRRLRLMLAHYLDPSCHGILFRTARGRKLFLETVAVEGVLSQGALDRLHLLCDVSYPTLPVRVREVQVPAQAGVIFMARSTEKKGADIAATVFNRLAASLGESVDLLWVGAFPRAGVELSAHVRVIPTMDRSRYLDLLQPGQLFLSPTEDESYGMGLIEAACHGMCLVTSCGPGMEHIKELFQDKCNAYLIDNNLPLAERVDAFWQAVKQLLEQPAERQRVAENNLALCARGPLSIDRRNKQLLACYDRMYLAYDDVRSGGAERMKRLRAEHGVVSYYVPEARLLTDYAARANTVPARVWVT